MGDPLGSWKHSKTESNSRKQICLPCFLRKLTRKIVNARQLVERELGHRAAQATVWDNCVKCGNRLHSKGWQARSLETVVGKIDFVSYGTAIEKAFRPNARPHLLSVKESKPIHNP